ncbi:MAG: efflux transporter outer membrane subunit [Pseudomonadota bacterium]|nr:efflux transporter outer membrane subunit [Pseudomonadota bacterium]
MTRHPRRLAPLVLAALAGCAAVGPDYQRPAVALPAAFSQTDATSDSSASTVPADWWRLYDDVELTRLETQALASNATIEQAVARVEFATAQLREAGGAFLPRLDGNASAARQQSSALSLGNPTGRSFTGNGFALSLSTSYEIDFWGKLRRTDEAARAALLASAASRDTVRLTVAGAVAQNWFLLRSLDAQIDATRRTLQSRQDGLRVFQERLKAGVGSRLDVQQAEILRADSATLLRDLQRQRALTVSQLGVLSGEPGLTVPPQPLAATELPPLPPPGLPSSLLERRPDLRAAEAQLAAANAQIGVARANQLPSVSLTGAFGQQSTDLGDLLNAPARFWSIGIGLVAPIFDGGRLAARTEQAQARQREATGAYRATAQTAFKEVADALANLRAARESAVDVQSRDRAARDALQLAKARFDAGYSGNIELLDAQRTATAAELVVISNRQQQLNASVDLLKALGGGWQTPEGSLPAAQR